jgi:hypothetical protein
LLLARRATPTAAADATRAAPPEESGQYRPAATEMDASPPAARTKNGRPQQAAIATRAKAHARGVERAAEIPLASSRVWDPSTPALIWFFKLDMEMESRYSARELIFSTPV